MATSFEDPTGEGSIGPEGPEGPVGPEGPPGKDGEDGAEGPVGAQGPQGVAGAKGEVGAQGVAGATGATGAKGDTGPQGVQGPTGKDGPQGPEGKEGPQGPDGEGTVGAEGPQGPQGPQGVEGPKGAEGPQGPKGSTGATGADGIQGPKGDTGATGPEGPQGVKGETGAQGVKGDTGAQGEKGPKGDTGATGEKGAKGDTGATGPEGPKGEKGEQGIQGKEGPAGAKGDTGATGPEGASGLLLYDAKGDILVGTADNAAARLALGAEDLALISSGGTVKYGKPTPKAHTHTIAEITALEAQLDIARRQGLPDKLWWACSVPIFSQALATGTPANKLLTAARFTPYRDLTAKGISIRVTTAATKNDEGAVMLYDATGTTLLAKSGAVAGKLNVLGQQNFDFETPFECKVGSTYYAVFQYGTTLETGATLARIEGSNQIATQFGSAYGERLLVQPTAPGTFPYTAALGAVAGSASYACWVREA
jgi:hypothetical protein